VGGGGGVEEEVRVGIKRPVAKCFYQLARLGALGRVLRLEHSDNVTCPTILQLPAVATRTALGLEAKPQPRGERGTVIARASR